MQGTFEKILENLSFEKINFLILELESSISRDIRSFLFQGGFL